MATCFGLLETFFTLYLKRIKYIINNSLHQDLRFYSVINTLYSLFIFFLWRCDTTRVMASSFLRFLDHTQRRTTVGKSSLEE